MPCCPVTPSGFCCVVQPFPLHAQAVLSDMLRVFRIRTPNTRCMAVQVVRFKGKAALPGPLQYLPFGNRFDKLFAQPADAHGTVDRAGSAEENLLGRVDVNYGGLGRALYPLYFQAHSSLSLEIPGVHPPWIPSIAPLNSVWQTAPEQCSE